MLVIKVELWPWGNKGKARELARMYVANMGGDEEIGHYRVATVYGGIEETPKEIREVALGATEPYLDEGRPALRSGDVRDYPRLLHDVWRLVCQAVKACYPEER